MISKASLKALTERTRLAVDKFTREYYREDFRNHLGASEIGDKCWRALWYGFRWVNRMQFTATVDKATGELKETSEEKEARMRRLFARGHSEESRLISLLRGAGFGISEGPEPGKQWRINDVDGHFGGSLDGFAWFPESWGIPHRLILELKSHNQKSYDYLKKHGIEKAKPMHVAQTNCYGYKTQTHLALYVPLNKNDDDLSGITVRAIEHREGAALIEKAKKVIYSQLPLARLHRDPSAFECRYCDHWKQCHDGAPPSELNCRSCKHSSPVSGAAWRCGAFGGQLIPPEVIPKGCPNYYPVDTGATAQ